MIGGEETNKNEIMTKIHHTTPSSPGTSALADDTVVSCPCEIARFQWILSQLGVERSVDFL